MRSHLGIVRKSQVRPRLVQTELGIEKHCTKCNEPYPIDAEYFYRDGKDKNGQQKFTTYCKDCYKQSYHSKLNKQA